MRSIAWPVLIALALSVAVPVSAAPAVADLDVAAPTEEVVVAEDQPLAIALALQAELECTVGFDGPEQVRGTMRAVVREDGNSQELGRAPFAAAWVDAGDGRYLIDADVTFELSSDHEALAPGDNDVVVQFLPDQVREPTRRCQADGYRVDPAEEALTITVVDGESDTAAAAYEVQNEHRFRAVPMVLAVGLVALLALFAFRRQHRD